MAEPDEGADDVGQWTRYFLTNASNIPRLLEDAQACCTDLHDLLMRLEKSIRSLLPTRADPRFICGGDVRRKATVAMFSASILGSVVNIGLSDKWYMPSEHPSAANLEVAGGSVPSTEPYHIQILARAIRVLLALLDLYSQSKDGRDLL